MKPIIIPVFLPNMGCRERCLFCNQKAATEGLPSPSSVQNFIEASLARIPYDKKNREKQVAFYGGSFTAIRKDDQVHHLKTVRPFLASGLIDSIRISTRPDALDEEALSLLKEYGVKTVEVGVQSMIDEVLLLSKRGHCAVDTVDAISRLKGMKFEVGLQLMIGLPGDTCDRFLQTLDRVIELKPDFLRIHPTLVLKGAPLEILWKDGGYSPLHLDKAVQWLKKGILKLEESSIRVARIGLQPTKELERDYIAGPYHPALHQLIDSAIFFDMATSLLQVSQKNGQVLFLCHPKEVSNLRGQKNENILRLKKNFKLSEVLIEGRQELPRGFLGLQIQEGVVSIDRKSLGS
ncbi:MAG: radical SAM protein [Thermodesulfobacteriota bacterium]|jgi:histone acetyltransferase (RNA polymerase elongator complex component)